MELLSPSREVSGDKASNWSCHVLPGILANRALEFHQWQALLEAGHHAFLMEGRWDRRRNGWEEGHRRVLLGVGRELLLAESLEGGLDSGVCGLCSILFKVGDYRQSRSAGGWERWRGACLLASHCVLRGVLCLGAE